MNTTEKRTQQVYIVLSRSNTRFAKIIRVFTKGYYNHTSIAFDLNLDTLYSFGRLIPYRALPGGFVIEGKNKGFFKYFPQTKICVLKLMITDEEYENIKDKLKPFLNNPRGYKYNLLKLPFAYLNIPFNDPRRYTCSAFVAYLLEDVLEFNHIYSLTRPEEFLNFNLEKIAECEIRDY